MGQGHQSSRRHTAGLRGVREKGKERDGCRERADDNIYLACGKRDSKTTREKEKDLCGNDMDDERIQG